MIDEITKALAVTIGELARLNIEGDPADPETGYQICALQCRQYALHVARCAADPSIAWMEEDKYQKTLAEWEKRRSSAETNRKNRLLPIIMRKLSALEGASSKIAEHANNAEFWPEDE